MFDDTITRPLDVERASGAKTAAKHPNAKTDHQEGKKRQDAIALKAWFIPLTLLQLPTDRGTPDTHRKFSYLRFSPVLTNLALH